MAVSSWHYRRERHASISSTWENSATGREYGTIEEFISDITGDHLVNFDSITWEWELPAVAASDVESDVVLVCMNRSTQSAGDFDYVHALTYHEYLKQCKWADFIMDTLDVLAKAELESANGGTFYSCTDNVG
jgi:hypothetical protein